MAMPMIPTGVPAQNDIGLPLLIILIVFVLTFVLIIIINNLSQD
jgi:hypothetical protein